VSGVVPRADPGHGSWPRLAATDPGRGSRQLLAWEAVWRLATAGSCQLSPEVAVRGLVGA